MPIKIAEFNDTFDTGVLASQWPMRGQYARWDAVRKAASLNANGAYMASGQADFIDTRPNTFDLTGSSVYARLVIPAAIGSGGTVNFKLVLDNQNLLIMQVDSGSLTGYRQTVGSGASIAFSVTYNPAIHGPWWRIRESWGIHFDCSTDGRAWTELGFIANPTWSLTGLSIRFEAGDYNNTTPPGPYQVLIDNVNSVGPSLFGGPVALATPEWARLTGPKGDRPNPYFFPADSGFWSPYASRADLVLISPHIRYDTSWTTPQVFRTWQGICFMEGLIRRSDNGAIANATVLGVVPVGWCPPARAILQSVCSGDGTNTRCRIDVDPNGNITMQDIGAGSAVWVSMCGFWPIDPSWRGAAVPYVPPPPVYPGMARSVDYVGYSGFHGRTLMQNQGAGVGFDNLNAPAGGGYGVGAINLRDTGSPVWTAVPSRAADSGTGATSITHANVTGTDRPMPPGWSSFVFPAPTNTAPQNWVATDANNNAWQTTVATGPIVVYGYGTGPANFPAGSILALFVNNNEVARTTVTTPNPTLQVWTEYSFAVNDVLSMRFYNPTGANISFTDTIQAGPNTRRPYLRTAARRAEDTGGDHWVCPASGTYDIHFEGCGGSYLNGYSILVNRQPKASFTVTSGSGTDDYTIQTMDVRGIALTVNDVVGIGCLMNDYSQGWVNRIDGAEGTAQPYLRITNRAPQ